MSALHPVVFVLFGLALGVAVVLLIVHAVRDARAVELDALPVPVGASGLGRAEGPLSSHRDRGAGSRRGRQPDHLAAQERAARDALRCAGGRVDVAPVRCPVDEGRLS